jgi:two-component system cell cycle sensor histidine kinase/response regulator CckA
MKAPEQIRNATSIVLAAVLAGAAFGTLAGLRLTPVIVAAAALLATALALSTRRLDTSAPLARLASLTEQNPDPVVELRLDGRVTYFNAEARRSFPGVAAQGMRHPSLQGLESQVEEFMAGRRQPFHRELTLGESVYEQEIAFYPSGRLVRVFSHDITAIKNAQRAALESEERYRNLFERNMAGVYRVTERGKVLDCNAAFAAMFGYPNPEAVKQAKVDGFHFDPADRLNWWDRLVRDKQLMNVELCMRRRDGSAVWVLESATLVESVEHGRIAEGTMIDITAEHNAREALSELASIVQSSGDAIIGTTREGDIRTWNAGAQRMFGYIASEVVGRSVTALLAHPHGEECRTLLVHMHDGRSLDHYQIEGKSKEGRRLSLDVTLSPVLSARGDVIWASMIARDVTDQRSLELQLRQAQKMEAVGRLAGGIAHDFNNILTIIGAQAELLEMQELAARQLERVGKIRRAADRASALTRQLLAFSRQQMVAFQTFDLNDLIAGMREMLQPMIGEDIEIVLNLQPGLPGIKADPVQIEQVIFNLAVNARDAMPKGGRLLVETREMTLDDAYVVSHPVTKPGEYVMLAVTDTGQGMDAATRSRIFEPFFTTKPKGVGTGLGLATVYGIIKQSNGYVWVYSEVGVGTTFKIYLPAVNLRRGRAERAPAAAGTAHGDETVLVAEDDGEVRMLARESLENNGYRVLDAGNGEEALKICREHSGGIDLLLTDLIMPQMSGRELAEHIRLHCPRISVLYMSGYTDDSVIRRGVLEAGLPFIQKPFSTQALVRKVREVLDVHVSSETGPSL